MLSLCFLADGKPVEIPFRQIDWRNWYLVQLRFTPEQAALIRAYDAAIPEIRQAVDGLLAPYLAQDNKKETA